MRFLIAVSALALAACQTPCPPVVRDPINRSYHCEDGSDLQVTFNQSDAHLVQEGYPAADLPERAVSSGFRYADGGAELIGRGGTSRWTRPGAAQTVCRETTPPQ
jgi:hypothetical protein